MTPPAATAAGRATERAPRTAPRPARAPRTDRAVPSVERPVRSSDRTHRRTLRPSGPAPRSPRRISGPLGGAVALPLPGRLIPPLPRPSRAPARSRRPAQPGAPLGTRLSAWLRALPDHRWLDRLVRGRAWIPLLGVLLVGIVAIQVEVLKLGTSIGRSVNLATQLQSRNELLTASVAQLSSGQRITREATKLGMYMPGPTETGFVAAGGRTAVSRAISGIHTPDSQAFLSALANQVSSDGTANPTLGSTGSPVTPGSPAATPVTPGATVGTGATGTTGTTGSAGATGTTGASGTTGATGTTGTVGTTNSGTSVPVTPTTPTTSSTGGVAG